MKNWKYISGAEVGNAKYDIAFQGQIDGNSEQYYFVYDYQTDPGAHRPVKKFKTRDEAKAYAKKLNEKEKVGNSKVGNFTISEGVKGKQELETKYKNNLRVAKEALSRISRKISGYENASNINWGHLGDIARIADLLSEI